MHSRLLVVLALMTLPTLATALQWPQEVGVEDGAIVIYQPQPERLTGNRLTGRAAMSLELADREEPIFGAFWFEARLDVDRSAGTALVHDFEVTRVVWPDSRDEQELRFTTLVEAAIPEHGLETDIAALRASLDGAELERRSLDEIKNAPPTILFREELAVLLLYDGEPRFSDIDGTDFQRALNTPLAVARRTQSDEYYLISGQFWYGASGPTGPWRTLADPPSDLRELVPEDTESDSESMIDRPPAIVSAVAPTELVVTDGTPRWSSVADGRLLYVENTETPWLRDIESGAMYLLLSGRWFRADSKQGPWEFVRADELPQAFADVSPEAPIGGIRTAVAGTPEANDAVAESYIPETTAIDRKSATFDVEYDGEPSFEAVPGTDVAYAVNTGSQVLEVDGAFYAVDHGVWFESKSATGPWTVADRIPEEKIEAIPPSSPVYNTTYVHVYESTPEVVYVGYTPGYLWSFPYYGVPVYGTGWYYPPYWGRHYYPRTPTWGLHVGYNPWTGWNFGVSWSNGFLSVGARWSQGRDPGYRPIACCSGWYGGGYRRPVIVNTGDINIGNTINIGNRTRVQTRISQRSGDLRNSVYRRPETRRRNAPSSMARESLARARPAPHRANDVFADRNGTLARRTDDGWRVRENNQWSDRSIGDGIGSDRERALSRETARSRSRDTTRSNSPQTFGPTARERSSRYSRTGFDRSGFDHRGLERDFQSRQRGMRLSMPRQRIGRGRR